MVRIFLLLFVAVHARSNLYRSFPSYYQYQPFQVQQQSQSNLFNSIKSQFHSQDESGQYSYGYNDGVSSKIESKTADGITKGSYAYIDSNGVVQNVNYISDDVHGFRVSASNVPAVPSYQYSLEEEAVPSDEPQQQEAQVIVNPTEMKIVEQTPIPMSRTNAKTPSTKNLTENSIAVESSATESVLAPSKNRPTVASTVIPVYSAYDPISQYSYYPGSELAAISVGSLRTQDDAAALSPVYRQFHSQDELGQYSYGYSGGSSSKIEMKTMDGITRGGYSYVDANGILQHVNYISDPINGFRVRTTNFPITNVAPTAYYPTRYQFSPLLNFISNSRKVGETE